MITINPRMIEDLLVNPGIGFIAAPGLMGELDEIHDSRGKLVGKYKFTPESATWNHPDSGVYYCGVRWKDLEPEKGEYNWEALEKKLETGRSLGCINVVRAAPYALAKEEDIPVWLREKWPEEPEFPFWRIDPNTTDYAEHWARFIRAFAARYDGHPDISSVDMAIVGAWGEGGGTEFMDEKAMDAIIAAYMEGFIKTPLQALLHDPRSLAHIKAHRAKVGFRVDCLGDMGGFHPGEWSHMLDFYPQNIVNFGMEDAWQDAPVIFEACWHMNDWYLQGWDINYIVDESLKWHISSYNSKGTTVPEAWRESVERWVRRMGYRYEIHQCSFSGSAAPGGVLEFSMLCGNTGVAPCYHQYPLVVKLSAPDWEHDFELDTDIRTWMPDEDVLTEATLMLPNDIPNNTYTLKIGFPIKGYAGKTLQLAIEGRDEDGFYPMGKLTIANEL